MRPSQPVATALIFLVCAIALAAADVQFACGAAANASAAADSCRWRPGFHRAGPDRSVSALTDYDGLLTVGGEFKFIGAAYTEGVARWNGTSWEPLGDGITGSINCLLVDGGLLYAGGKVALPGGGSRTGVAVWDGNKWAYLPGDIPLPVTDLTIHHEQLHASSSHRRTGSGSTVHRWTGTAWEPTGDDFEHGDYGIATLESFGDSLFASWNPNASGETLIIWSPQPAFQDASGWHPLSQQGDCWDCYVEVFDTITTYGGKLVGGFDYAEYLGNHQWLRGGLVAAWTGTAWRRIGNPLPEKPYSLVAHDGKLYTMVWRHGVHEWNGTAWSKLEGGPSEYAVLGSTAQGLAASSQTKLPDESDGEKILLREDGTWRDLTQGDGGLGLYRGPRALALPDSTVIAFGDFVGSDPWECWSLRGDAWVPGPPTEYWFHGYNAALYHGDVVTTAYRRNGTPGQTALLRLHDDQWDRIGSFNDGVFALQEYGDALVVGGSFTRDAQTGVSLDHVAVYRGESWQPMGGGMDGIVTSLAVDGSDLLAGGTFDSAGAPGVPALHVARWNGTDWEGIGEGIAFNAGPVAWYRGRPVAAGVDPNSPWDHPRGKAAWFVDGQWIDLGAFDAPIYELAVFRDRLVAGGTFRTIDGEAMPGLAWFDGTGWSPVAGGVDGSVWAIAIRGPEMWIGGDFRSAGGIAARNIAVLDGPAEPPVPLVELPSPSRPWPNPSAQATHIPVTLDMERHVRVTIHDVVGREVARIEDRVLPPGRYDLVWSGAAGTERRLASGVYYSRIEIDGRVSTHAFLRIR